MAGCRATRGAASGARSGSAKGGWRARPAARAAAGRRRSRRSRAAGTPRTGKNAVPRARHRRPAAPRGSPARPARRPRAAFAGRPRPTARASARPRYGPSGIGESPASGHAAQRSASVLNRAVVRSNGYSTDGERAAAAASAPRRAGQRAASSGLHGDGPSWQVLAVYMRVAEVARRIRPRASVGRAARAAGGEPGRRRGRSARRRDRRPELGRVVARKEDLRELDAADPGPMPPALARRSRSPVKRPRRPIAATSLARVRDGVGRDVLAARGAELVEDARNRSKRVEDESVLRRAARPSRARCARRAAGTARCRRAPAWCRRSSRRWRSCRHPSALRTASMSPAEARVV